ncbi:ABC transporter substrate-binding protein [Paenibacillus silviterrae]|uniref:ABC transporter substrate-binding protein n=1 Tax=Paenibacillus silviterrae TaxID=3242194 RepID=UPI002543779C|nr:extracellular solute-binding protein [Paenibacillus chinjuensis]
MKKLGITLLTAATMVSGCGMGEEKPSSQALKELGKDEKATVKVLYYDRTAFFQQYGNLLMAKYPNIDIEVISNQGIYGPGKDPKKEFRKLMEEQKPDILLINNLSDYEQYVQEGLLYELDGVIKQDKFDVENIIPAAVELIRNKGGGKLYALTPNFYSQAIYYNKDLFDKHGVPYPKNQMTWEDLLALAKRFPTQGDEKDRIYGLSAYHYVRDSMSFSYLSAIGMTHGLTFVDPASMKVTLQTDGWKRAMQLAVDAMKSGTLYQPKNEPNSQAPVMFDSYLKQNPFIAGHAAMTIESSYLMDQLERAKEILKDVPSVNWDIVTVPVDPLHPDVSNTVNVSNLYAIQASSPNIRAAWEVVKYINSDEMARIQSKSSTGLVTRTKHAKEQNGRSLEPFYLLKPSEQLYKDTEKIPQGFYSTFMGTANTEIQSAIDGKKSIEDALQAMQQKGEEALTAALQQQKDMEEKEKGAGAPK